MKKKTPTTYFVPALEKALDVVEYLSRKTEPLPLSVIAKDLGRTSSELFRIMDYLVQRNYVIKESNLNSYTLSLKFFELTFNIPLVRRIVDTASPFLNRLSSEIGYSSHVSVIEGGDLVIIHEQESIWPVYIHVKIGARIPATATSSGCLLLGLMSDRDRRNCLDLDKAFLKRNMEEQNRILQEIRKSSEQEVYISPSKQHERVLDIVAPIELFHGKYAALAVPISSASKDSISAVKAKVSLAAAQIQRNLLGE